MDQTSTATLSAGFANPMSSIDSQLPPGFKSLNPDQLELGLPDQLRSLLEENRQLRQRVADLEAHVAKLEKTEREVMALVKAPTREKIVHDLRNVLNELVLLQAIAGHDD